MKLSLDLDARLAPCWLAASYLRSLAPGRWLVQQEWGYGQEYEHDGPLPTAEDVLDVLDAYRGWDPRDRPRWNVESRWMRHVGQGSVSRTASELTRLIKEHGFSLDPLLLVNDAPRGWMVCEQWRSAQASSPAVRPPLPYALMALALLGAAQLGEDTEWITNTIAAGELWGAGAGEETEGEWFMVWSRQRRPGEPHSGALGVGTSHLLRRWSKADAIRISLAQEWASASAADKASKLTAEVGRGPGRPREGEPVKIRMSEGLRTALDQEAALWGATRAEVARRILGQWAEVRVRQPQSERSQDEPESGPAAGSESDQGQEQKPEQAPD